MDAVNEGGSVKGLATILMLLKEEKMKQDRQKDILPIPEELLADKRPVRSLKDWSVALQKNLSVFRELDGDQRLEFFETALYENFEEKQSHIEKLNKISAADRMSASASMLEAIDEDNPALALGDAYDKVTLKEKQRKLDILHRDIITTEALAASKAPKHLILKQLENDGRSQHSHTEPSIENNSFDKRSRSHATQLDDKQRSASAINI